MTNKKIAERIRNIIQGEEPHPYTRMERLADELDPPRPEPGTVVWMESGRYGITAKKGILTVSENGFGRFIPWDQEPMIDPQPARMLADDEVAAIVPSIGAPFDYLILKWHYVCNGRDWGTADAGVTLTSDDVERMEAER
jgi:hypothetical protein